jgi:GNAT superfamily N-acetyltransferase
MSQVRQATAADIPELVRLRALLFDTLGGEFANPAGADDGWLDALAAVLREQLTEDTTRILVVDGHGDGTIAACGIGAIAQWLPSPSRRNGRMGHVIGVVTDPAHRRRGHSRAIMRGLLDWFRDSDVPRVDLHASPDGEPLYRALGFVDYPDPALSWRP